MSMDRFAFLRAGQLLRGGGQHDEIAAAAELAEPLARAVEEKRVAGLHFHVAEIRAMGPASAPDGQQAQAVFFAELKFAHLLPREGRARREDDFHQPDALGDELAEIGLHLALDIEAHDSLEAAKSGRGSRARARDRLR